MDQSSSVISDADSALYITFYPELHAEPIPLPITSPRTVFVCSNSLVVSDKVVHSRTRYNLRAFESLVAARVLAHKLGVPIGATEKLTLREFLDRWLGVKKGDVLGVDELKKGLDNIATKLDLLKLVESDGSDGTEVGVTLEEMIELSGLPADEFRKLYLDWANSKYALFFCVIVSHGTLQLKRRGSSSTSAPNTSSPSPCSSSSSAKSVSVQRMIQIATRRRRFASLAGSWTNRRRVFRSSASPLFLRTISYVVWRRRRALMEAE